MSKFHKRISKTVDITDYCLVLDSSIGAIETFSEIFNTVFVYKTSEIVFKSRKLVYQEKFEDLNALPHFNFVYTEIESIKNLEIVKSLLMMQKPVLMIKSENYIDKRYSSILKECRYELVDFAKGYQIWKKKR